jgi:hypothetical protein
VNQFVEETEEMQNQSTGIIIDMEPVQPTQQQQQQQQGTFLTSLFMH